MNEPRTAARMEGIAPFHVMDILARAQSLEAAGRDIIHLEIGEPDFATPAPIVEAGVAALHAGHTRYTGALGLPALREAIAGFHATRWQATVDPARVVVTPGASGALLLALGLLAGRGDEVLMADPGYPCNRHFTRFCDARAVTIAVDASCGFQLTLELIMRHASPATRAVLIASPSNPTGTAISRSELVRIHDWCSAQGVALIVDEIYLTLTYDGDEHSAAHWDDVFVINSFSKGFLMTGWRLGWLIAPDWALPGLERLAQNLFLAAATPAQHAALAAFLPATLTELDRHKTELSARRDYLLSALRWLGFVIPVTPQGAFYVYADCSRFAHDSHAFANQLLGQTGIAVTPGIDFGSHHAKCHVRFAYTQPLPRLAEAVTRLERFLQA
ncbi:MAG: aminotransferase class I/II-fold pyridoxal phosphate-dependent enzyme [Thiobacillus sp.]|uniref:aminotransferase class I/II-fold pyridoxal phosphate-dependent enzyme n=1 Tax=Thiobacillus sp. TaxID=924 RepID=UPI002895CC3D|nr:aminotransferase class I/II-fold pyridoxal phosphate-dependent enzyme [Thiobacillus sp.]MDT3707703.1 aminotransferase class I/II-fold pyridoxal phosphate-dependent enzyme [Thiobacillus sp.]